MSKFLTTSGTRKHIKLENNYYSKDTPDVQISKVLEDQKKMNGGGNLKNWSLSARKELAGGKSAAFLVPIFSKNHEAKTWSYEAPKLAMVVASPVLRDHFVQNPESTEFHALNSHFKAKAIEAIAHWLRIAMTVPELRNIQLSKISPTMSNADLKDSLDLRVAMQLLGMSQYIDHFASKYQSTLVYPGPSAANSNATTLRVPHTDEARTILDHAVMPAQNGRDEVVDALAYHLVVLKKKKMLGAEWTAFLADFTNLMLSHAMKLAEARFTEKVKKERKEREKTKKDGRRREAEGGTKKDKITASDALKNSKGAHEAKPTLSKSRTTNLFDLLSEEDE
ncbi:uncharacterized protein N0V89_001355 [Didymosphaeria variabile]|uniref:Uncharacterized protein n=1 Tax=Didymosphaeria variabile TaxID=1932322 RepID=A0A9W8XX03_9PLEO|nr:uncharacterized protein N0V89_001355 [Didymosphaeria variabile]KAJ4360788.1 hypothetical protein N0V89_001355 [Didymosphaeria variabile]